MFNNIQPVTKNLLILNIFMFVLTLVLNGMGIDLRSMLSMHSIFSPLFEPYQIASHFFMHGDVFHIFFNMFALVMFGSFLEHLWGPKRFFLLYCASALGGLVLYTGINSYEILQLRQELKALNLDYREIDDLVRQQLWYKDEYLSQIPHAVIEYRDKIRGAMLGASGAVFGVTAAFAILFPNTELQLLFPPIPIKAKYLIGGYFVYEVYRSIYQVEGDNVAHLAHVGGAVVGAILVLYWRRKGKNFY